MTTTPVDAQVYYHGIYWNSYPRVVEHLNRRAFDRGEGSWTDYLGEFNGGPFDRGLSLNCGTGWVERELIDVGSVRSLVAVDYLDELLATARDAAVGYPIEFHQLDTNTAEFPAGPFDLVVNHAAGHHISHLDGVLRRVRELLAPDGLLATWDYTGPHRNQYGSRMWEAAHRVNGMLPEQYRSPMAYPHLPTMLVSDPSEAVHSELILDTMDRYFTHVHQRQLGGPIAYLVLTHNEALFTAAPEVRDPLVDMVVAADVAHIESYPEDNLFSFLLSRPKPASELEPARLEMWTRAEHAREQNASVHGGRYYLPSVVELRVYKTPSDPEFSAFNAASRGIRFNASALARAVCIRFPVLLSVYRAVRRVFRRGAGGSQ